MNVQQTWLDYVLYATISEAQRAEVDDFTQTGTHAMASIERHIARFYREDASRINGIYLFHYRDALSELPPPTLFIPQPAGAVYVEFIRLRIRVSASDRERMENEFFARVIVPASNATARYLKGWTLDRNYSATRDVGSRFGDSQHGFDTTETVVRALTAFTELRFRFLDHPEPEPNHDLAHLYLSVMGENLSQEIKALETCADHVRRWNSVFLRRLAAVAPARFSALSAIEEPAPVRADCNGYPVRSYGFTYVYDVSPDFDPDSVLQSGNGEPWKKIRPRKSWEIGAGRIGSTPARSPGLRKTITSRFCVFT